MSFGIIEYNKIGNPTCEICKKSFKRVLTHVRQRHFMNEREYKLAFGFDLVKGICNKESSEKTKIKTLSNCNKCIETNLLRKGHKTRFLKGDPGRTKEKVQEQTRIRLKERLKEPNMIKAMKASGEKVGKSGLGNLTRWGKKNFIDMKKIIDELIAIRMHAEVNGELFSAKKIDALIRKTDPDYVEPNEFLTVEQFIKAASKGIKEGYISKTDVMCLGGFGNETMLIESVTFPSVNLNDDKKFKKVILFFASKVPEKNINTDWTPIAGRKVGLVP